MTSTRRFKLRTLAQAAALAAPCALLLPAHAQQAPDAGQNLRQLTPRDIAPSRPGPVVELPAPMADSALSGGATATVTGLRFSGNTVLSSEALAAAVGEVAGKAYDLAGLKALAQRATEAYRAAGYPFARAYLPAQALGEGELQITVVEGRYGQIDGGAAQAWFGALKPGAVIHSAALERSTLILSDQPGVQIAPVMRPGQEAGTGDLVVNARRVPAWGGDASLDNHGNRYTGAHRASVSLRYDSPFLWGDQLTARLLASDQQQWLGSVGYSAPLATGVLQGLRGQLGYSHTAYELGKDFSQLEATGTAKTTSAGLSAPIVRSQRANLGVSANFQHKALTDKNGLAGSSFHKSSRSLALSLNFDQRDALWGGGVSYGALAYTSGQLRLNGAQEQTDIVSGRGTRGHFGKWNLDLARVQNTGVANLSLMARLSTQAAAKNLDSSEGYSLGGTSGVRAYPQGEASGDRGWTAQLEARMQLGALAPYVFHDVGRVTFNAETGALASAPTANHRTLGGVGLGLRHQHGPYSVDAALAWRTRGGVPISDTRDSRPRFWVTGKYAF